MNARTVFGISVAFCAAAQVSQAQIPIFQDSDFPAWLAPGHSLEVQAGPSSGSEWEIHLLAPSGNGVSDLLAWTPGGLDTAQALRYTVPSSGIAGMHTIRLKRRSGNSCLFSYCVSPPEPHAPYYKTSIDCWYTLLPGQTLTVQMIPDLGTDWNVSLYDPAGSPVIRCTNGPGLVENLSYNVPIGVGGYFRLRVDLVSGTGGYSYSVGLAPSTTKTTFYAPYSFYYSLDAGRCLRARVSNSNVTLTLYSPNGAVLPAIVTVSGAIRTLTYLTPPWATPGLHRLAATLSTSGGYEFSASIDTIQPDSTVLSEPRNFYYRLGAGQSLFAHASNSGWDMRLYHPNGTLLGTRRQVLPYLVPSNQSGTYRIELIGSSSAGPCTYAGAASQDSVASNTSLDLPLARGQTLVVQATPELADDWNLSLQGPQTSVTVSTVGSAPGRLVHRAPEDGLYRLSVVRPSGSGSARLRIKIGPAAPFQPILGSDYFYDLAPGQTLTFRLFCDPTADWNIRLCSPDGQALLSTNAGVGEPETLRYTVPWGGMNGTVRVNLYLSAGVGGAQAAAEVTPSAESLRFATGAQSILVSARPGDSVTARATSTGTGSVSLTLFSPDGEFLAHWPPAGTATFNLTLPADWPEGPYRVEARSTGFWGYVFTAATVPSAGNRHEGTKEFDLALAAGENLSVRAAPDVGVDLVLQLFDSLGVIVAEGNAGGAGSPEGLSYLASSPGTFRLRAHPCSPTGAYSLSRSISGAAGPQDFATAETNPKRALRIGDAIEVRLTPEIAADWDAQLYSPSNKLVAWTSLGRGEAETLRYTVPPGGETGNYRVRIFPYSGSGGCFHSMGVWIPDRPSIATPRLGGTGSVACPFADGDSVVIVSSGNPTLYAPSGAPASVQKVSRGSLSYLRFIVPPGLGGVYRVVGAGVGGTFGAWAAPSFASMGALSGTHLGEWTYRYRLSSGQSLRLRVETDPAANYGFEFGGWWDYAGPGGTEVFQYTATAAVEIAVRVSLSGGWGAHRVSATVTGDVSVTNCPIAVGDTLANQRFEWLSIYAQPWEGTYAQYTISLEAGKTTVIETTDNVGGTTADTLLFLLRGESLLAWDDNSNGGYASRLTYTPTVTGPYIIRLRTPTKGAYGYCSLKVSSP